MASAPCGPDPPSVKSTSAILPLIASGLTVLLIVLLLALAAQGSTFALVIALVLMAAGCAACYWLVQSVSTRQDSSRMPAEPDHGGELSVHDLPLDALGHHRGPRVTPTRR